MAKNVTIQRIVGVLLHRIKFIILATVVMGLLFFMYSRFVIAPMYSTSTMIYVQNYSSSQRANANANTKSTTPSKAADDTTKKTTNEENQKIYPADISASANLAEICVTLFKNSDEMTALYDGCTVNVDVTDGTFFITITVDGTDAQKCANVANQLAEKAAEVYNSKFSYGQIGTLRQAKVPSAPYAPSNTKNMLIGAAIGLIASCLISILIELIDTTIKSEDDIPIFAEIPGTGQRNFLFFTSYHGLQPSTAGAVIKHEIVSNIILRLEEPPTITFSASTPRISAKSFLHSVIPLRSP